MATIQKRGNGYRVQVRRKGLPPQSRSFPTRKDAKRWADQLEGRKSEARSTTLGEALKRYLAEVTPSKKGAKQERHRINAWLLDPLACRFLASIRSMDIASWRTAKVAEGKAPTTIRNALTIISQVYAVAISEWGMEGLRSPVAGVRLPKLRPGRDRRLLLGEEERLLDACSCVWLRSAIIVSIETSLRQGELLSLRREHIRGRMAFLSDTKNGRSRHVALSSKAWTAIDGLPASMSGKIFPMSAMALDKRWRRLLKRAGISGLHWHDLRHEAVSRLFEKGLTAEEVMQMSGHRTYSQLQRYTHLRSNNLLAKLG